MAEGRRGNAREGQEDEWPHREITESIIAGAIRVQRVLGPGLLESTYETCLAYELRKGGHAVASQVGLNITYGELNIPNAYRLDMVIDDAVVIEIKTVDRFHDIHYAQLLSYLRFSSKKVGLLLNFWAWPLKEGGIKRIANSQPS